MRPGAIGVLTRNLVENTERERREHRRHSRRGRNDDPLDPICSACRARVREEGDAVTIGWLERDARYVEKLATPDVTIADMVGDIDPIKAARAGLQLSSDLTMHYGLLPRANRGIFEIGRAHV